MEDKIKCPKCGSQQITANKKGFSGVKSVAGAVLAGPLGIAAGTIGSNKVKLTCLKCGNEFYPGEKPVKKVAGNPVAGVFGLIAIGVFIIIGILVVVKIVSIFL